ncbi:MAG: rRNA pseudouridine synthase [Cyanobacteria bacterium]|nr:rRNA pseudouridine synthase [Cyanobacteriota bacterium]
MATTARGTVSLERALSKLGLASRSQARALITQGRVRVDGAVLTNPSIRIVPERVAIEIDGTARERVREAVTILLHKPRGYVTTRSDPEGRKTVYDLLADLPDRVVPVGRLDRATSGLLILTNETQLANWLTDPSTEIPRVYLVTARGEVTDEDAARLTAGVISRGERIAPADVVVRKRSKRESHVIMTLTEGKNREIRRLFDAIDHPVTQLRRVQFGGLQLGDLAPGQWRRVGEAEVSAAFPAYASRRAPRPK